MSKILNPSKHLTIFEKREEAKRIYHSLDKEYYRTLEDYRKYNEILYRISSEFIKFNAAGYERMLNIKSYHFTFDKVIIIADSIEILFPSKCIIQDNVTLEYSFTDDSELLSWKYECGYGFGRYYNISDWCAFLSRGLKCKEIISI